MSDYKKVLKQRNMYLKEREIDPAVLGIWDYELARYGSRIIRRREEFIKRISEISSDIHDRISGGLENLTIHYEANVAYSGPDSTEAEFYKIPGTFARRRYPKPHHRSRTTQGRSENRGQQY